MLLLYEALKPSVQNTAQISKNSVHNSGKYKKHYQPVQKKAFYKVGMFLFVALSSVYVRSKMLPIRARDKLG